MTPRLGRRSSDADLEMPKHPVFRDVSVETLARLQKEGRARSYERGELVLREGEARLGFFVLLKGSVRVFYTSPEGEQLVCKLFHAPAVFGEMECLADIPYLESVETLERCRALEVPRDALNRALQGSHQLALNLLHDVSARLCIAAQNERALAFLSVEKRLANLLGTYGEAYGLPTPQGLRIRVPLSQEDLAHALGVARRSITRALQRWSSQGLVKKQGRHFVLVDPAGLARLGDTTLLPIGHRMGKPIERAKLGRGRIHRVV